MCLTAKKKYVYTEMKISNLELVFYVWLYDFWCSSQLTIVVSHWRWRLFCFFCRWQGVIVSLCHPCLSLWLYLGRAWAGMWSNHACPCHAVRGVITHDRGKVLTAMSVSSVLYLLAEDKRWSQQYILEPKQISWVSKARSSVSLCCLPSSVLCDTQNVVLGHHFKGYCSI